ncbi:MAG TPA: hypothetical protein VH560_03235 [Polyangia bacterium]|jgi:hypothetical protein|nr:hypothetical protein [Polyangia bacterium]
MSSDEPESTKKPYEKPTLSEVALRPEEAVLGNCKTTGISGPAMADCTTFGGCSTNGS